MENHMNKDIEIFWGSGSPFSWRVLLACEVKGIPYVSHRLAFDKKEHQTPDMLKLNPRGKLPVMRHGDFVLSESLAIIRYLDHIHPANSLFGSNAQEESRIWSQVTEFDSFVSPTFLKVALPVFMNTIEGKEEEIKSAAILVHEELQRLEDRLKHNPWLAGTSISAADVVAYPSVCAILRAGAKPAVEKMKLDLASLMPRYPNLEKWSLKISALPGSDNAYPPHWKQAA
jgi:glutathione S-transferase